MLNDSNTYPSLVYNKSSLFFSVKDVLHRQVALSLTEKNNRIPCHRERKLKPHFVRRNKIACIPEEANHRWGNTKWTDTKGTGVAQSCATPVPLVHFQEGFS